MMFKVFISASSLERLCLNEMSLPLKERSNWFVLLSKQNVIYLDKDIYSTWTLDDPLFMFSQSFGITFKEAESNYNDVAANNPTSFLEHPHDAFLLDLNPEQAEDIKNKFGVMCQSTQDLSKCPIAESGCHFNLVKNCRGHSWSELFADSSKIPSNSLIIVDRYLFGYEGRLHSGYVDGVNNIKQILSAALPQNISCDFNVLIIFDAESSTDHNFDLDAVASELEYYKTNDLRRPYNIDIELLSVTSQCPRYEETHNRRVLSNYYIVYAEHLLKAFKQYGESMTTQKLNLDLSYSEGLRDRSDVPQKAIDNLVSKLQELFYSARYAIQNNTAICGEYTYYINGQLDKADHLKNRLLLK